MPPASGKLIVIEGLEGAGKSTAVTTVINLLNQYDIKTVATREPGGTAIGELLRAIIKNVDYKDIIDDRSELLLLYTARMQLIEEVIKPALKKGYWVIADRFELSTIAYQGGGRGLDQDMINRLSQFCLAGFKPDLTLFLDISPEEGMHRAQLRGQFDRIEQQGILFFHRIYEAYMSYIKTNKDIEVIDASLPLDKVQLQIVQKVSQFIEHQR